MHVENGTVQINTKARMESHIHRSCCVPNTSSWESSPQLDLTWGSRNTAVAWSRAHQVACLQWGMCSEAPSGECTSFPCH